MAQAGRLSSGRSTMPDRSESGLDGRDGHGAVTRNETSADGRRTKRRIMGVDVARGFALIGMIAADGGSYLAQSPNWQPEVHGRRLATVGDLLAFADED